jgi:hypothetical protein
MLGSDLQKQAEMRAAARMSRGEDSILPEEGERGEAKVSPDDQVSAEGEGVETSSTTADNIEGKIAQEGINESAKEAVQAGGVSIESAVEETGAQDDTAIAPKSGAAKSLGDHDRDTKKEKKRTGPKKPEPLLPGQFPFNLPAFAAPFLFIPPYLEVSFTTCSAIYMRHPTITPVTVTSSSNASVRRNDSARAPSVAFKSDLPSPYPASGEIFSLAWEHYAKNSPRIRSDLRRLKMDAKVGRNGIQSARAKDEWKKVTAIRRGHDKKSGTQTEFRVGSVGKHRAGKVSHVGRFLDRSQAKADRGAEARV